MITFTESLVARLRAVTAGACDRGASLVEYAMLVMLIAVVCVVAISTIGTKTSEPLSRTAASLETN